MAFLKSSSSSLRSRCFVFREGRGYGDTIRVGWCDETVSPSGPSLSFSKGLEGSVGDCDSWYHGKNSNMGYRGTNLEVVGRGAGGGVLRELLQARLEEGLAGKRGEGEGEGEAREREIG